MAALAISLLLAAASIGVAGIFLLLWSGLAFLVVKDVFWILLYIASPCLLRALRGTGLWQS